MEKKWNNQDIKINRLTIIFYSEEDVRNWRQQILITILEMMRRPSGKSKRGGKFQLGLKINHGRQ